MIYSLFSQAARTILGNAPWMGWNLFLAIVPLVLSVLLFRRVQLGRSSLTIPPIALSERPRSILWWVGVVTFVAFLPNAPYILTDIKHFIDWVRTGASIWTIALVYIPLYAAFLAAGFEAYVLSLLNVRYFLKQQGLGRYILTAELMLHGLSAIGIYLGRFLRFNSWHILTQSSDLATSLVEDVLAKRPLFTIALTFLILTVLYSLLKTVHLALITYWKFRPQRQQKFVIPNF